MEPRREQHYSQLFEGVESGGVIDIIAGPVELGTEWDVERLALSTNSVATTQARVYVDSIDGRNILDGTGDGNFDVADNNSPIRLAQGQRLLIRWSNTPNAGSRGWARLQYTERRVDSMGRTDREPRPVRSIAGS